MPFGPQGLYRAIPAIAWQSAPQVARVLELAPPGARIVDLGAGGRRITPGTVCVDFLRLASTDVIGDVARLPFRDGSADLVYATGLLEHVVDERAVLREMARILKPGGLAHVEVPFLEQYHEDPIDVRRMTVPGLALALEAAGFDVVSRGAHIGPTATLLNAWARWWALVFDGPSLPARAASLVIFVLCSTLAWPFKFLDALLIHKRRAHTLALGVYCTGRKRGG
ncbi:MAG: class I SAM-dependent methyltransferase [Planctomycetes bacterium]|nr:class I SAM-dependent methyltransferase [Planctomycetota bacterium]